MGRPFEQRPDRPFKNLSEVHHAGKAGLNRVFTVGSIWEYGPFVEGDNPVIVRVVERGAYTSGTNHSRQPEDSCALGNPTWFIQCQIIHDPFGTHPPGHVTGYPPHTLVPAAEDQELRRWRSRAHAAEADLKRMRQQRDEWQARAALAEDSLKRVKKALA